MLCGLEGGLLLVDGIDASLHPHLLEVLLGAFADPLVNTLQAQLIFTSHESYVLSPLSEVNLGFRQVGKHHEIYLSDPRKVAPEKLRTILRQPVTTASEA